MNADTKGGYFVVSLDFELYWGMIDKVTLDQYGENLRGVRTAIPEILNLFQEHQIHATWAAVGMLLCRNKHELMHTLPQKAQRPVYDDMRISTYHHIEHAHIGDSEEDDPYHFAPSLIRHIIQTPNQELASHTFSHYYCIDGSKNSEAVFTADCVAERIITQTYGVAPTSIIFPRNQTTEEALRICAKNGITAYRGNEEHFLYKARSDSEQSFFIRALRLIDHYINISGHHGAKPQKEVGIWNIPASRFLRPFSKKLRLFEPLRLHRIKRSMTHAAKNGLVFHLWWHPHNFGSNTQRNLKNLESLLQHFHMLEKKYGMQSKNMHEIATHLEQTS